MSGRRELPAILSRAMIAAATPTAQQPLPADRIRDGVPGEGGAARGEALSLDRASVEAHRLIAGLITVLLLELEGLVDSPLNKRARARVRLGAPSRSRILSDWKVLPPQIRSADLFPRPETPEPLPLTPDPVSFFREMLRTIRSTAERLELDAASVEEMIRWLLPEIARCAPEDDPVGWIHAHSQRHRLVRGPGSRLRFQVDRDRGRSQGVLYTPPLLTEALVDAVLKAWSSPDSSAPMSLFEGAAPSAAPVPRVLDPACGSGQFLLSLSRRLLPDRPGKPTDVLAVFRSMHGVDIDPGAATLAAFNLSLQAVRALCKTQGADPPMVVDWLTEQVGPGFPWFLGSQIHQGNALLLAPGGEGGTFRWTERFGEVFSGDRPGFDVVIGNPPWVSFGLRDRAGAGEEEDAYLRRLYSFGAQYKLSLYPLFIELALRLTRPGGLHGFLIPDSFFTGRHFSKIRAHLLEISQPLLFCLVESGPWPGVHVGHTGFYCVRRLPVPGPPRPVVTRVLRIAPPNRRRAGGGNGSLSLFTEMDNAETPVLVDPESLRRTPHQVFRIYRDEKERLFAESLERSSLRLEEIADTYSGLIARYGQESVTGAGRGPFVLRDRAGETVYEDPDPERHSRPALHSGSEVEPFRVRWRGGSVYIPGETDALRVVYKSGFDLERYRAPKIFLRQTGDRLVAARDESGLFCLNNVHILSAPASPRIDLRFLCGLLMSHPIQRYYQIVALEAGRPLAQVDLATVRTLPFPCDASGAPYGEIPPSSDMERLSIRIDPLLSRESPSRILALVQSARDSSDAELSQLEGVGGRLAAGFIVSRIVAILESVDDPGARARAQDLLDRSIRILFGMSAE